MTSPFPLPDSPSPKLVWLKKHRLAVEKRDSLFACHNAGRTRETFGLTEDEAILTYCELFNLRHYSLE